MSTFYTQRSLRDRPGFGSRPDVLTGFGNGKRLVTGASRTERRGVIQFMTKEFLSIATALIVRVHVVASATKRNSATERGKQIHAPDGFSRTGGAPAYA